MQSRMKLPCMVDGFGLSKLNRSKPLAALAVKTAVADIAPVVVTAVATTVAQEIIAHGDDIIEGIAYASIKAAGEILDGIDRWLF